MNNRLRIVVLGYIIRGPLGGITLHHLQYAVGLHRMGHDVYFLEDSDDYPSCYQPGENKVDSDPAFGLGYAGEVFSRVGLHDCWAYWHLLEQERWMTRCNRVAAELAFSTSDDAIIAVADLSRLAWSELKHRRQMLPFVEMEDGYSSAPVDDAHAIGAIADARKRGAAFLALPWTAFWWLEYYIAFREYLDRHGREVHASESLRVIQFQ